MTYTIEAAGLTKSYRKLPVLTGLDLQVRPGTVFALLGPNGAGKTTTVRILATLIKADGGVARVAGHDVVTEAERVRGSISLTGQYAAVDELLTGRENLAMMARLRRFGRRGARRRTAELLEQFDLGEARDRRVATYSGGMRRKLDLAMSLVSRPPVIFLDEPTTGLDPRSRRGVWDAVAELRHGGVTILLTTQYLEEADRLADRIAVLDAGSVVAEGTAEQLKEQVGTETVELYLADDAGLARAAAALEGWDGGRIPHVEPDRRSVRVGTDGSAAAVGRLLVELTGRGITVQRLEIDRPSLDEVFLTLTERADAPAHRELERI